MTDESRSICPVVLVYGDRPDVAKETLEALHSEGIGKIVIVANSVSPRASNVINVAARVLFPKGKIVTSAKNIGTAGGYSVGVRAAMEHFRCKYIWLLDDDNKPRRGAARRLVQGHRRLEKTATVGPIAVCAYRPSMSGMRRIIHGSEADLFRPGSFCGFHLANLRNRAPSPGTKALRDYRTQVNPEGLIQIRYAPYGGLLFEPKLISEIGLPDRRLFLFGDDSDFTFRISDNGGTLCLVPDAVIDDIEGLSHNSGGGRTTLIARFRRPEKWKVYLETRNRAYLSRVHRRGHRVSYYLNAIVYCSLIIVLALITMSPLRGSLIIKAIYHGHSRQLESDEFR